MRQAHTYAAETQALSLVGTVLDARACGWRAPACDLAI